MAPPDNKNRVPNQTSRPFSMNSSMKLHIRAVQRAHFRLCELPREWAGDDVLHRKHATTLHQNPHRSGLGFAQWPPRRRPRRHRHRRRVQRGSRLPIPPHHLRLSLAPQAALAPPPLPPLRPARGWWMAGSAAWPPRR